MEITIKRLLAKGLGAQWQMILPFAVCLKARLPRFLKNWWVETACSSFNLPWLGLSPDFFLTDPKDQEMTPVGLRTTEPQWVDSLRSSVKRRCEPHFLPSYAVKMCPWKYFRWAIGTVFQSWIVSWEFPWTLWNLLRKPASWLVAVCERSENRGCGGGWLPKGTKSRRAPVLSARKRSILLDDVPLDNTR